MGGCFSDVKGGQQAVVRTRRGPIGGRRGGDNAGCNDAISHFFRARGALFSPLELSLSASKLRDRGLRSKSSPMAVVYLKKRDGMLEELGRTEVKSNSLDPAWIGTIFLSFFFPAVQHLVFHVYDVNTKYHNVPVKTLKLNDQDFLGEASCALSEIITKLNRSLTLSLHDENSQPGLRNLGTLTIHAEESFTSRTAVEITFCCSQLENKYMFSKCDPFLRITRIGEYGGSFPICETEVIKNNLNPIWGPLCLSMQQFGSKENQLVIECFDFNTSGNHALIGKLHMSMADLEKLHKERNGANLIFLASHHGHEKVLKSQLFVDQFCEKPQYSFLDYISGGFELNFMVAVDFTASNGNPRKPNSLHYIDPLGRYNSYQQAIMGVGEVIQFYDSDRRFSAWGFGGRIHGGTVSHCFNLNGTPDGYEVEGVEGIMAAYVGALHNVALAGPTLFGPVISRAAQIAHQSLSYNHWKYFILLIITDGDLTDQQETVDALVRASVLPLSLMIVGVGAADFTRVEKLDADKGIGLESSTGHVAMRNIVQFVPMREVHCGNISLVHALLEELPGQFLTYMRARDIKPFCPFASLNNSQQSTVRAEVARTPER